MIVLKSNDNALFTRFVTVFSKLALRNSQMHLTNQNCARELMSRMFCGENQPAAEKTVPRWHFVPVFWHCFALLFHSDCISSLFWYCQLLFNPSHFSRSMIWAWMWFLFGLVAGSNAPNSESVNFPSPPSNPAAVPDSQFFWSRSWNISKTLSHFGQFLT